MPYYRRKKKSYRKRRKRTGTFRKRVKKVIFDTSENKHIAESIASQAITTSGIFNRYPEIQQGDNSYERNGNRVRLRSFQLRATLSDASETVPTLVRLIIARTKMTEEALTAADFPTSMDAFPAFDHLAVMHDKTYMVGGANNPELRLITLYKRLNHYQTYDGPVSTDPIKGSIFVYWLSSSSEDNPTVSFNIRCYYKDV